MEEKEEICIVAIRVEDAVEVVQGSVHGNCSECGKAIWLAPSSLKMGYDEILCIKCALKREGFLEAEHRLAPGWAEELMAHLRKTERN